MLIPNVILALTSTPREKDSTMVTTNILPIERLSAKTVLTFVHKPKKPFNISGTVVLFDSLTRPTRGATSPTIYGSIGARRSSVITSAIGNTIPLSAYAAPKLVTSFCP